VGADDGGDFQQHVLLHLVVVHSTVLVKGMDDEIQRRSGGPASRSSNPPQPSG
jgi:hypothetical protein